MSPEQFCSHLAKAITCCLKKHRSNLWGAYYRVLSGPNGSAMAHIRMHYDGLYDSGAATAFVITCRMENGHLVGCFSSHRPAIMIGPREFNFRRFFRAFRNGFHFLQLE